MSQSKLGADVEVEEHELTETSKKKSHRKGASKKEYTYEQAVKDLSWYSHYWRGHSILERMTRFFSTAWNRNHIKAADKVLDEHTSPNLPKTSKTTRILLEDLKAQLEQQGQQIEPNGSMAKTIDRIQKNSCLEIIKIKEFNMKISATNSCDQGL